MTKLQSRWEGDGDEFTLVVGADDDGIEATAEEWAEARERYASELQQLLAVEHGYTKIRVEVTERWYVNTLAAAKAARQEYEMQDAIGFDVYADLTERAWERAWAQ